VAWFFLSWRILKMPLTFVGSAVFQVFYSKASKEFNQGESLRPAIGKIYGQMFLLGLPVCLTLLFAGPPLFEFVFGAEWRGAGEMSQILSLWLFANFIVSPVSCIAMIAGKQKQAFALAILEHGSRLGLLAIGGYFGDLKLALWLTTASGVFMMIVMMYWYRSIAVPVK
jgi:O-antigen/teichoic acid export membrane protein